MNLSAASWVLAGAAATGVAAFGSPLAADINFRICGLVIVAVSWNLMAGAGLISLGHSAFWGLGAYVAILSANRLGIPLAWSLIPAMLCGAAIAAALALITGRLRGIYFAISTLAMSEGLRVVAVMLPAVTGGSTGLYLDTRLAAGNRLINLGAAGGAVAAALIAWALTRSRYHFALRAMRDNETAAQMLGIEPIRFRVGIMALCGAMASYAGGLGVWHNGYLDPGVAFDLQTTIDAQIAPILGGIYSLPGPAIGAVATVGLGELTRLLLGKYTGASLLVFGILLVVVILALPKGIYSIIRRDGPRRRVRAADPVGDGVRP